MVSWLKNIIKGNKVLFEVAFFLKNFKEEIYSLLPWFSDKHFNYSGQKPFHGDTTRQDAALNIFKTLSVTSIIETGTYKGTTTEFFAKNFSGPIFTCELMGLYFRESRRRLKKYPNVRVIKASSPLMLFSLKEKNAYGKLPFFYLDAHWYDYWPIVDELKIIKTCKEAIVMIDDFEVAGRSDLGYDVGEVGGRIIKNNLDLISKELSFATGENRIFFPKYYNDITRGYVVIFIDIKNLSGLINGEFFIKNYKEYKPESN